MILPQDVIEEVQMREIPAEADIETHLKESKKIMITGFGQMLFGDFKTEMNQLKKNFNNIVDFCPEDSSYCATALAIEWLLNGGKSISVSFNGVGGYAKLEEVMMSIQVIMHKKMNMDLSVLPKLSELYEIITQSHIKYNKAIIGKNIFNLEAGVQAEKSRRNELTYEPYDPALVGKTRKIVIGKYSGPYSGPNAIKLKLKERGIQVADNAIKVLLKEVKDISMDKRRSLTDREFLRLADEVRRHWSST